jgi:hypothetical protein
MAHNHSHTIASPNEINHSFMIGIALNFIYVIVEIIYGFNKIPLHCFLMQHIMWVIFQDFF